MCENCKDKFKCVTNNNKEMFEVKIPICYKHVVPKVDCICVEKIKETMKPRDQYPYIDFGEEFARFGYSHIPGGFFDGFFKEWKNLTGKDSL